MGRFCSDICYAMEEMAGLQVLCADKTGTLTKNELEVQGPVIIDAKNKDDIIKSATLTVKEDNTGPIDKAILERIGDKKDLGDYGIMIQPVGWGLALSIWAYSIVWLFIINAIKVIFIKAAKKYIEKGEQIQSNR